MTKSVCIFGCRVAEAVTRGEIFGGAELQMALLAKTLASAGIPVTMVDPMSDSDAEPLPGLRIRGIPDWNRGLKGVRLLTHRIPTLFRALRTAGADIYYVRSLSFLQLIPMLVARLRGATFVVAVAHDTDLMGFRARYRVFYRRNSSPWTWLSTVIPNEIAVPILLAGADVLLVQHRGQLDRLRAKGKDAVLLGNIAGPDLLGMMTNGRGENVAVIGAITARKNLRALFPLIRKLPGVTFEFIGEPEGPEGESIARELKGYPNVLLRGGLDRLRTLEGIARARAVLNTSREEGFPNTFIEAWALGTPVLSLYCDPAGILAGQGLGYPCGGDLCRLEALLRSGRFPVDPELTRRYVRSNHSPERVLSVFRDMLEGRIVP